MQQLLRDVKIEHLTADGTNYALSAGTTDVESGVVDMADYGGVCFLVTLGDNADTGTFEATVQQSDDAGGSPDDFDALSGAQVSFTAGASDTDHKMIAIDVKGPLKRYLRLAFNRGTANTVIASVHALKYLPRERPVTQGTGAGQFISGKTEFVTSPAEA